jgi:hypothetical protein
MTKRLVVAFGLVTVVGFLGCGDGDTPGTGGADAGDASSAADSAASGDSGLGASAVDVSVGAEDGGEGSPDGGSNGSVSSSRLRITPAELDFGLVNCGSTANAQTVAIRNDSATTATWSATLGKADEAPFTVVPTSGTLAAGASATVTVTPRPIPSVAPVTPNALGDTLTVATDIPGDSAQRVSLSQTAHGAILAFSPRTVDFGGVPLSAGAVTNKVGLANSGNAPATVSLAVDGAPAFTVTPPASPLVAALSIASLDVAFKPQDISSATAHVNVTVGPTEPLCAPLPPALELAGRGSSGSVLVTPRVAFGNAGVVDCGTTATPGAVTVENIGNAPLTFTAVLGKTAGGAPFTVSPSTGAVPAGGKMTLSVTPRALPSPANVAANFYGDTLTVTTNVAGDAPHAVALEQSARGLILSRSTSSLSFGSVAAGATGTATFTLTNTGNVGAIIAMAAGGSSFAITQPITLGPGISSASVTARFTPTAAGPFSDLAVTTVPADVPLCAPLPGTLTLAGAGVNPSIVAVPTTASFGFTPCGTQAAAQTVSITNNGPATTFTAMLDKSGFSPFTVSPASGNIGAGATLALTVTPKAIPAVASVAGNAFGDIMRIASGSGTLNVSLNQTAAGAVLTFRDSLGVGISGLAFGTVAGGTSGSKNLRVRNDGNGPATFTLAIDNMDPNYAVSPSAIVLSPTTNSPDQVVTFKPQSAGAKPQTLSMKADGLCSPPPAPLILTGTGG